MSKYIIVTTFCDKKEIAQKISSELLKKKLVTGSQITKVRSLFWWKNKIKEIDEYKVDLTTKNDLYKKVEKEINELHDYELPAISCTEIINGSSDFLKWIEDNTIE